MNNSLNKKSLLSLAIIGAPGASQDVPIAITALTDAQMDAFGVQQSFDIATFTPGVHISGNLAGQNTQFSISSIGINKHRSTP